MRYKKIIATLLSAALILQMAAPSFGAPGTTVAAPGTTASAPETTEVEEVYGPGTVSQNETGLPLGLHGMELSAQQIIEKQELSELVKNMEDSIEGKDYRADRVYFTYDDESEAEEIADCYGADLTDYGYGVGVIELEDMAELEEELSVSELLTLAADTSNNLPAVYPDIAHKTTDYRTSGAEESYPVNDPYYYRQWAHSFTGTEEAWAAGITGEGVKVAIIDTGVDHNNEDLAGNLIGGYNAVRNVEGDYDDTKYSADAGHGTHVAGIVAAETDNGAGGCGIAPKASIMPIRVFEKVYDSEDEEWGLTAYSSKIVRGVNYAVNHDADVINMSIGSAYGDPAEKRALENAERRGVVTVCAAGNDYSDCVEYPAALDCTISVAALSPAPYEVGGEAEYYSYEDADYDEDYVTMVLKQYDPADGAVLSKYSNTGDTVDIAAPGSAIYSTMLDDTYCYKNGTSMASPVVAGAVALILQSRPKLLASHSASRTEVVRNILKKTAKHDTYEDTEDDRYTDFWFGTVLWNRGHMDLGLDIAAAVAAGMAADELEAPSVEEYTQSYDSKNLLSGEGRAIYLNNPNSVGEIYYTTDGTKPDPESAQLYDGEKGIPLNFSGRLTLKAVAAYRDVVSPVMEYTEDFKAVPTSISVNDISVMKGKKAVLKMDVSPEYATLPDITWNSGSSFSVKKSRGTYYLKAIADSTGETVTGSAKAPNGTVIPVSVNARTITDKTTKLEVAKNITLAVASHMGEVTEEKLEEKNVKIRTVNLAECIVSEGGADDFVFRSSNPKVAEVDMNGVVSAKKSGRAVITVTANDGSGRKAKCRVNVITPVVSINRIITSTGFDSVGMDGGAAVPIARGGRIKLTASLNDYDSLGKKYDRPTNSKIDWSIEGESYGAQISSKGVLKMSWDDEVAQAAEEGRSIKVVAKAADGYGAEETILFKIYDRHDSFDFNPGIKRSFAMNLGAYYSNELGYGIEILDGEYRYDSYITTLSRDDVLLFYTDEYGDECIQPLKKGRVKVTYTVPDGSGMRLTQTIRVK